MSRVRENKITHAWLETPDSGLIELASDWHGHDLPPLSLGPGAPPFASLTHLPPLHFARRNAYYIAHASNTIHFILWPDQPSPHAKNGSPNAETPAQAADRPPPEPEQAAEQSEQSSQSAIHDPQSAFYLVGDHNDWQRSIGNPLWRLHPAEIDSASALVWSGPAPAFLAGPGAPPKRFKFATASHQWLDVPHDAPNAIRDAAGNTNRQIDPARTGLHLYQFTLATPLDPSASARVHWLDTPQATLRPAAFLLNHHTSAPLGAFPDGNKTLFRIYAPRATTVELCVTDDLSPAAQPHRHPLRRNTDLTWEITLDQNLHGWYYWYHIDGPKNEFTRHDPARRILDPCALATVCRDGPGIILDRSLLPRPSELDHAGHRTPAWQDLVICEAHLRDLTANAPIDLAPAERLTFSGLAKWVDHPSFYLHRLGVNCVELQPVQEFDNASRAEYHWGYMPANYFSPASAYSTDPARASGIAELQQLVAAFHRRGIAVLLDVVYNHIGEPPHLLHIDQLAYLHTLPDGSLSNWSGCGNDLNADSPMARRLIIDSLLHLVETYAIDGFRLDLAELLGLDALREIERALKKASPGIILIAEPWSFRGHIAGALRDTGWASWNDGYRNFLRDYVRGGSTRETYEYYLKGSPWHFAKWPAQTINYTESHDDRCWLDTITENPAHNGAIPTENDRRRTRLMAAVLFMSIGVPMLSAGQDFLRSKQGANNTYLRGDLNALDYTRILRFPSTHACFAEWIRFRLSERGSLLRHYTRPRDEFFRFYFAENTTAAATLYNADCGHGPSRLLFAINPALTDAVITLPPDIVSIPWIQIADQDRFYAPASPARPHPAPAETLLLPPLSCVLWEAG